MWTLLTALATPPSSIPVGQAHDTSAWIEAPPACIDAVGDQGKPPWLEHGPVMLGTYEFDHGEVLETPRVRIRVFGDFIPTTMGASTGDHVTKFEVTLRPNIDIEKPSPFNTVSTWVGARESIGTYQVQVTELPSKGGKRRYRAVVEDVGCHRVYMVPRLKPGQAKTFWLATDGVQILHFRELSQKYLIDYETLIELSAGLDPDVQQGDTEDPHGWYRIKGIDRHTGAPVVEDRVHRDVKIGEPIVLMDHTLTVLKVEHGEHTRIEDGKVFTKGGLPKVRMLLGIARSTTAVPR